MIAWLLARWCGLGLVLRAALLAAAVVAAIGLPRFALAACNDINPVEAASCEMDSAQYGFYEFLASTVWSVNRVILIGAYQLDTIRANVIDVAFTGAYDVLTELLGPALVPAGTLALVLALLAIVALPITGTKSPFNVRHILLWLVVAPILLTYLGRGLLAVETFRMDLGNRIFQGASEANFGQTVLGAPGTAGDFGAVPMLYPSNLCGVDLDRHSGGSWSAGDRRIDELVVGYLFANTQDIHCPGTSQYGGRLPGGYYERTPPYAWQYGVRGENSTMRLAAVAAINEGFQRQILGLLPAILALLYYLLNLVFSLALVALWVALPIGMLFGFFAPDSSWFADYVKRAAGIIQASWVASFIIGLLLAALMYAAQTSNGAVFAGVAGGAMFFMAYNLGTAVQAFQGALSTVLSALGAMAGMTGVVATSLAGGIGRMASGGARAGAAALTGGVSETLGAGAAGAMALARSGGNARYAMGAVAGRFKPLAGAMSAAGAVLGASDKQSDVLAGARVGSASRKSFQEAGRMLQTSGTMAREQVAARRENRELNNIASGGSSHDQERRRGFRMLRGLGGFVNTAARDVGHYAGHIGLDTQAVNQAITRRGQALSAGVTDGVRKLAAATPEPVRRYASYQARRARRTARAVAATGAGRATVGAVRGVAARVHAAAAEPRSLSTSALLRREGVMQWVKRLPQAHIPSEAQRETGWDDLTRQEQVGRLKEWLSAGEMVQQDDDGVVTHWKPDARSEPASLAASRAPGQPQMGDRVHVQDDASRAGDQPTPGDDLRGQGNIHADRRVLGRSEEGPRLPYDKGGYSDHAERIAYEHRRESIRHLRKAVGPRPGNVHGAPRRGTGAVSADAAPALLARNRERLQAEREIERRERRDRAITREGARVGRSRTKQGVRHTRPSSSDSDTLDWLP